MKRRRMERKMILVGRTKNDVGKALIGLISLVNLSFCVIATCVSPLRRYAAARRWRTSEAEAAETHNAWRYYHHRSANSATAGAAEEKEGEWNETTNDKG
jgi:hypothetical protein